MRSLASILLFSLALAVQAIAPATAGLVQSSLGPGQICATLADVSAATVSSTTVSTVLGATVFGATSATPAGHDEAGPRLCDLCALCCGGAAPPAAHPEIAGVASPDWAFAEWAATLPRVEVFRPDHARRARAPPLSI
ncbi:MAG TPA: hypothetical protein VIF40_13180 [Methylosinus sp.]|jgi:hypothetical protein|uniref:hypothetical protein n=1 Tax=Methylosinus sp. TaxID=427 RepID=UPI002F9597BD